MERVYKLYNVKDLAIEEHLLKGLYKWNPMASYGVDISKTSEEFFEVKIEMSYYYNGIRVHLSQYVTVSVDIQNLDGLLRDVVKHFKRSVATSKKDISKDIRENGGRPINSLKPHELNGYDDIPPEDEKEHEFIA